MNTIIDKFVDKVLSDMNKLPSIPNGFIWDVEFGEIEQKENSIIVHYHFIPRIPVSFED